VYNLDLRMAADGAGKLMHVEVDGVNVSGPVNVPNTGGWQIWQTVTVPGIALSAGEHVIRLAFDSDYMNINYMEFNDVITGIKEHDVLKVQVYPNPFSESGLSVNQTGDFLYNISDISGALIESGTITAGKTVGLGLNPGVYIISINNETGVSVHKIVKK